MREILFRGKRLHDNKWIYGNFVSDCEGNPHIIEPSFFHEDGHHLQYEDNTDTPVFIIPETVGQFTGLTDKNGVRIFEGDIVKTHYANAQKSNFIEQVVFHNGRFCAYFNTQSCKQWVNLYDGVDHFPQDKSVYMDSVEVIGNIHDNPELLEDGEDNGVL